jgi:hypothetical protein
MCSTFCWHRVFFATLLTIIFSPLALGGDDYVVYSPSVTKGEAEIELRGFNTRDANSTIDRTGIFGVGIGYGFTSWWKAELYNGPFNYGPANGTHMNGYELENFFQLAEHGTYWVDPGFLVSYFRSTLPGVPNNVELGPLLQRETETTLQRLNLIWTKQVGMDLAGKFDFRATYMAGYKVRDSFVPGIEAYYLPADNARQIGPGFSGEVGLGHGHGLEYSAAVLFGINQGAPNRLFVMRVSGTFQ